MPKIWTLSDLHDDYSRVHFGNYSLPDDVSADVLVVAGDIAGRFSTMGRDWLEAQHSRLQIPIVCVPGNHDFWRGSVDREVARFRERLQCDGVHVLDGDSVVVEGVRFVGGALWTDYAVAGDPDRAMRAARTEMNDVKYIRSGTGSGERPRATPAHLLAIHVRHREAIRATLATPFAGPTVVVTHHAPSPRSLREGRVREPLDAAYASDLEDLILEGKPELWIHGHIHQRQDYVIGDTRVVANPRGYVGWQRRWGVGVVDAEESGYDERLVLDVVRRPRPIPQGYTVEDGILVDPYGMPAGPLDEALDQLEAEAREYEETWKRQVEELDAAMLASDEDEEIVMQPNDRR